MVHGHLDQLAERVGQFVVLVAHDAEHLLSGFEALMDVGMMADLDAVLSRC